MIKIIKIRTSKIKIKETYNKIIRINRGTIKA